MHHYSYHRKGNSLDLWLTCLLVMLVTTSKGQTDTLIWQRGSVVLNSGQVILGRIAFCPEVLEKNEQLEWVQGVHYQNRSYVAYQLIAKGKVCLEEGGQIREYSANELTRFNLFSRNGDTIRYISDQLPPPRFNNRKFFFRVEAVGELSLLSRQSIVKQRQQQKLSGSHKRAHIPTAPLFIHAFYSLHQGTHQLKRLIIKKQPILQLMQAHKKLIKQFMNEQQLSIKSEQDLVEIFRYYNSLNQQNN